MSEPPKPESDFDRMDRFYGYVWKRVRRHPDLEPVREELGDIYLHAHTEMIEAMAGRSAGEWIVSALIESPTWWDHEATGETFEGKGDRVIGYLVRELRARWEGRLDSGSDPEGGTPE